MSPFQGPGVIQLTPLHTQYNTSPCNCGFKVLDYAAAESKAASEARYQSQRPPLIPCESVKQRPKIPWTIEEQRLFLAGLEIYGKGHWKDIASFIKSKTSVQVASHAQKYFIRQSAPKKRKSIHDIALTESNHGPVPHLSDQDQPNSVQHQQNHHDVDMPMMEFNQVKAPQPNDHYNRVTGHQKIYIPVESNDLLDELLLPYLNDPHNNELQNDIDLG